MSRIIGGGGGIGRNHVAIHHAQLVHQMQHQAIQQNLRIQQINRQRLLLLANDVASTPAEDIQRLAEAVEEARQAPDPAAALTAIGSTSPFTWLSRYLPDLDNKMEVFTFIATLAAVLTLIHQLVNGPPQPAQPPPTISPEQVEEIIERVIQHQVAEHHEPVPEPCEGQEPS